MYQTPYTTYGSDPNSSTLSRNQGQRPIFSVAQAVSSISSTANNLASSSSIPGSSSAPANAFKAPAHKHAHHLHSIPPREKSTRTLIIDHMLWVHGRTRFAQARAELGMTDRTGGPSSTKYTHRERPENYEEDEDQLSDGEDARILNSREGGPQQMRNDDEDERLKAQDLALARSLRLRAESLEKVVTGMLDQPPPVHPHFDGDPLTPPSSPKRPMSLLPNQHNSDHPHHLPNGVRVRITLGTIINDLFARQAPPPPYRHSHHQPVPIFVSGNLSDIASSRGNSPVIPKSTQSVPLSQIPPMDSLPASAIPALPPAVVPLSTISAGSPTLHPFMAGPGEYRPSFSTSPQMMNAAPNPNRKHTPTARVRSLYTSGADPSAATPQSALRCPRHLYTGCEICVEAKSGSKVPKSTNRPRTDSGAAWGVSGSPGKSPSNGGVKGGQGANGKGPAKVGGGVTGWLDGSGIGSGLARPDVEGSVLRRRSWSAMILPCSDDLSGTGAGNTKLSELIPRFLRLSALVAIELGSEARDDDMPDVTAQPSSLSPSRLAHYTREQNKIYASALRPTREWYMLLIGLLTRAALEGYLTGGWRGTDAVECLLTVGLGVTEPPPGTSNGKDESTLGSGDQINDNSEVGDEFEWFDPDGLPSLREAARIIFPSLQVSKPGQYQRREGAEAEYEQEITERLSRFYAVPTMTPDLSTHMEDLAWHYPAEPVERATLRYCEAVAKWRGKPELESYKKKPSISTPASTAITIESLVHSNPTSPTTSTRPIKPPPFVGNNMFQQPKLRRPSIDKYFEEPPTWGRNKRRRSVDEGRGGSKRLHV